MGGNRISNTRHRLFLAQLKRYVLAKVGHEFDACFLIGDKPHYPRLMTSRNKVDGIIIISIKRQNFLGFRLTRLDRHGRPHYFVPFIVQEIMQHYMV